MVRFTKYEGLGNDFILLDERQAAEPSLPVAVRARLCDRHRGIGGDGVLTVLAPRLPGAVARMHITNPDGSVPEMCGNGLRCVSLFLLEEGLVRRGEEHVVDTDAGPRSATVLETGLESVLETGLETGLANATGLSPAPAAPWMGEELVRVDMGPARFAVPGQIPPWFEEPIVADGARWSASAVSMGNPHLVIELAGGDEPTAELAARLGPILEVDARFPERTNVELAAVRADGSVDVIVWERGVGITQACGTGACGAAAVLARAGRIPFGQDVVVRLPGGPLRVQVTAPGASPDAPTGRVLMTGPARRVFRGDVAAPGAGPAPAEPDAGPSPWPAPPGARRS
jgi:diaminopimelate epimerase